MAIEIEHKYLINQERWKKVIPHKSSTITQAYLSTDPLKTIRIRTKDEKGFITIKGKTQGASRPEFEYEIPRLEAKELIEKFTDSRIEKIRHYIIHENKTWEVDQFLELNEGLWLQKLNLHLKTKNIQFRIGLKKMLLPIIDIQILIFVGILINFGR